MKLQIFILREWWCIDGTEVYVYPHSKDVHENGIESIVLLQFHEIRSTRSDSTKQDVEAATPHFRLLKDKKQNEIIFNCSCRIPCARCGCGLWISTDDVRWIVMNYTILFMCVRLNVNNEAAYDNFDATSNEVKYIIQEFEETMHANATAAHSMEALLSSRRRNCWRASGLIHTLFRLISTFISKCDIYTLHSALELNYNN